MKKNSYHINFIYLSGLFCICSCFGDTSTPVTISPSVKDYQDELIIAKVDTVPDDSRIILDTTEKSATFKKITGYVKFTSSYCGGAHPPPEIIEQHKTPRPLIESKIKLVSVSTKKEYIITTDKNGKFVAELPEGKYNFYITRHINSKLETGFTPTCEIEINKLRNTFDLKNTNVYLQVDFECDPCDPGMRKRP